MIDKQRLDMMRHWAESDAFRQYPWVGELVEAYAALAAQPAAPGSGQGG